MVRTCNESVPVIRPVINGGHHLVEIGSQFDRKAEAKLLAGASPLQRGAQYLTYGRYEKSPFDSEITRVYEDYEGCIIL